MACLHICYRAYCWATLVIKQSKRPIFKCLARPHLRCGTRARHLKKTLSRESRVHVVCGCAYITFIPTHMQSHAYVVSFWHVPAGRAAYDVQLSFIGRGTNVKVRGWMLCMRCCCDNCMRALFSCTCSCVCNSTRIAI